jgi:hypothetical protein
LGPSVASLVFGTKCHLNKSFLEFLIFIIFFKSINVSGGKGNGGLNLQGNKLALAASIPSTVFF